MVEVLFPTRVSDVYPASLHLKIKANSLMLMSLPVWFLVVGAVLLAMVLTNAASRLFISNAMLYLVIG